ncbi:tripartite tricarboxylate transporter TctB family protein [Marinovum sp.]|uniref:tripartite tricarboxylate transporter TctB family protein n=1 Tax=Marinovum sp. TaxID=2024839 RepID=UPI002B2712C1|nr:tripartite tricarboxylate transporter TctB family protein [Marinovum sp.]
MPTGFRGKIAELAFLGIFALITAVAFFETRVTLVAKRAASGDAFSNSALFLEIIAGLMAAFVLVIAVQTLARGARPASDEAPTLAGRTALRLIGFVVIVAFYVASFRLLGYYIATTLTVAGMLAVMGTRSRLAFLVFPLAVSLIIGFVFEILFNVVLPLGFLGLTLQSVLG